jgi:cation:H+ antiporter
MLAGGEALVRGSVITARRLGVSPLLIGLTLVSFGTSTPELVACIEAALLGAPGIAIGNVVGSNIANVLLILGLGAVIVPLATTKETFRRDAAVLIAASLLLLAAVLSGAISRAAGSLFVLLLALYLAYAYCTERRRHRTATPVAGDDTEPGAPRPERPLWIALLLALGGLAAVIVGADLLVEAAIVMARDLGLSEAVIGLTLVALGTSLPELVTSVVAAVRRHADVAFGNIVGSNIFNVFGIAGLTAVVHPIPVPPEIAGFDIWVMLGATLLLVVFAATGWRVNRWEGGIFLLAYLAYLVFLLSPAGQALA